MSDATFGRRQKQTMLQTIPIITEQRVRKFALQSSWVLGFNNIYTYTLILKTNISLNFPA